MCTGPWVPRTRTPVKMVLSSTAVHNLGPQVPSVATLNMRRWNWVRSLCRVGGSSKTPSIPSIVNCMASTRHNSWSKHTFYAIVMTVSQVNRCPFQDGCSQAAATKKCPVHWQCSVDHWQRAHGFACFIQAPVADLLDSLINTQISRKNYAFSPTKNSGKFRQLTKR